MTSRERGYQNLREKGASHHRCTPSLPVGSSSPRHRKWIHQVYILAGGGRVVVRTVIGDSIDVVKIRASVAR